MKPLHCLAPFVLSASLCSAAAQSPSLQPIVGPIRDAGVLHLSTHTWTRHQQQALVGPNVIYDNSCPSGFLSPLSGNTYVDEGRVPSPTSTSPQGFATSYVVNGFQIGYCTDQTSMGTYTVNVYQSYAPCTSTIGMTPTASIPMTGLPAATVLGVGTCWVVTIDLTAPPSLAFTMAADGDGSVGGATDTFGWSMSSTAAGMGTGPIVAGNPVACPVGSGTGVGTFNGYYIQGGPSMPGCYWFGGSPFASFYLRLDADFGPQGTAVICTGDGVFPHTACPCANSSSAGAGAGCMHSAGHGGDLRTSGTASLSNDTLVLLGSVMTPSSPCLYFQGTTAANSGNGAVFGDGLRCASGNIVRIGTKTNSGGASHYPASGDPHVSVRGLVTAPGNRVYQAWFRDPANFCNASTFNLTNGVRVAWVP